MKNMLMFVLAGVLAVYATRGADLEFLKKLVEIPSASADIPQVNVAMRAMKEYLEKRGLFCTIETEANGRETLFAATKPGKVQDYILAAHLDVVPASWEGQYAVVNDNGRLTGRGVGDDKGGSLAVAQALCALVGKDVSVGCIFGADEELGGLATTWMVEKMGYRPRRMAIVVDSRYACIGYATKGQLMVKATLKGQGGHSSAFRGGRENQEGMVPPPSPRGRPRPLVGRPDADNRQVRGNGAQPDSVRGVGELQLAFGASRGEGRVRAAHQGDLGRRGRGRALFASVRERLRQSLRAAVKEGDGRGNRDGDSA